MAISVPIPCLDHVVINVADRLDEASALFRRLGFQLTERGHHSLGSSNHLAVFGDNYLELLGFEAGRASLRQDVWQSPIGLSGLVWKTDDADAVWRYLESQDIDGNQPARFFRPVQLPDGNEEQARFRTVPLRAALVPNGRSFFCQHETPHAVWQDAWRQHPNGVTDIIEFVVVAQDPAAAAQPYSRLFGANALTACQEGAFVLKAGVATIRFAAADYVTQRFAGLPLAYNGSARMAALSLRSTDLRKVKASLLLGDIPFLEEESALIVSAEHAFGVALRFQQ
ncbi:TPA: VOC family protein [Serratia fonticola]|nr:VOC family protein [Serratia fonticola]